MINLKNNTWPLPNIIILFSNKTITALIFTRSNDFAKKKPDFPKKPFSNIDILPIPNNSKIINAYFYFEEKHGPDFDYNILEKELSVITKEGLLTLAETYKKDNYKTSEYLIDDYEVKDINKRLNFLNRHPTYQNAYLKHFNLKLKNVILIALKDQYEKKVLVETYNKLLKLNSYHKKLIKKFKEENLLNEFNSWN